jgi:hypothetical protein
MNKVGSGSGAVTWVRSKVRLRKKHYKGLQPEWRSEGTYIFSQVFQEAENLEHNSQNLGGGGGSTKSKSVSVTAS